jgi:hypothetical protein
MLRHAWKILLAVALTDAGAATFTVDEIGIDLGDIDPGDGNCAWATFPPPDQRCTLRAAIMEANALAGADIIVVPFGAHIVLSREGRNEDAAALGDLDITGPLTIRTPAVDTAARAIVDANGIDRVFDVRPQAGDVRLSNLEIANGSADSADTYVGGGVRAGGGLLNVEYCRVVNNVANAGGGIFLVSASGSSLLVYDSEFRTNGVFEFGVTNALGAAIKDVDSGPSGAASITIRRSSFVANVAFGSGFLAAVQVRTPIVIENSTFSTNLPNAIAAYGTNATLRNVTITGSQVGYNFGGTSLTISSSLRNTIVAGNSVADCVFGGNYSYSHSYSLDSDGTCNLGGFGVGNLPMTDPMLKPLALRHGDTPVHDLSSGSPAIDHGDPVLTTGGGSCLTRDQDNGPRPTDGDGDGGARCDMGAVEFADAIFADGFDML